MIFSPRMTIIKINQITSLILLPIKKRILAIAKGKEIIKNVPICSNVPKNQIDIKNNTNITTAVISGLSQKKEITTIIIAGGMACINPSPVMPSPMANSNMNKL